MSENKIGDAAASEPEEAVFVKSLLHQAGIKKYDPTLINQLLCLTYNHVTNILNDAVAFACHANKKTIDKDDVSRAISLNKMKNLQPTNVLNNKLGILELASSTNAKPLPPIKPKDGICLPPNQYCLTATNYKLITKKKVPEPSAKNKEISSTVPQCSYVLQRPTKITFRPKMNAKPNTSTLNYPFQSTKRRD